MGFAVLGPFEVRVGRTPVAVRGVKERRLLALLVSRVGETVAVDDLVDALWGDEPPVAAAKSLHVHVARVRAALAGYRHDGQPVVERRGAGYRLAVVPEDTDAARFAVLVDRARAAAGADAPDIAARLLREALGLWRGVAYADFRDTAFGRAEAARWEELRLRALEERIDADLALGRHGEVTGELEALVVDHPLRERLWAQLMVALYRGGRQADALSAFRRARGLLTDQLGIEPSPDLLALERRILTQDPQLAPPDTAVGPPPLPSVLARPVALFLGRDRELATLCRRWDAVERGSGGLVIVSGASGSGRSTTVAELARYAHSRGAVVNLVALRHLRVGARAALGPGRPHLVVVDDLDAVKHEEVLDLAGRAATVARQAARLLVLVAGEDGAWSEPLASLPDVMRIRLEPLTAADARSVVRHLLGEAPTPDVVDGIVARGCGLPGRLRALAVQHLEREASDGVSAGVAEAPAARRALSQARATVHASVLDLQQARRLRTPSSEAQVPVCPFKGLARFEPEDAPIFHGREDLVAALVARLVDTPLVAVVGPSGAGKSSLVRAGLLPALAEGVLPGSAGWSRRIVTPGGTPRKTLAEALEGDRGGLVLVVDQFEELFVGDMDPGEAAGFVRDLLALLEHCTSHVLTRVVLTVRADHLGDCAVHPALAAQLAEGTFLVPPMTEGELRRAVERPAEFAGLVVEPGLLDVVVADFAGRPGALPLLSTALLDTWGRRRGRTLTEAGYLAAGGVSGAVARLAERAFAQLAADEQRAARRILLRLAETGGAGAPVGRRVPVEEVAPREDGPAIRALDVLAARRLVILGEAGAAGGRTVEVAHEALLVHWPRLARWLEDDEQGRALRRHLTPTAREWAAAGRPDAELYRGTRLQAAAEWAASHEDDLQVVERDFLVASRRAADRELREQRDRADREARGRRRLRIVLVAVVALLATAASAAVVAVREAGSARTAERSAEARRLGALALTEHDLDRSLLLAAAAVRTADSRETEGDLLAALLRSPQALGQARAARRLQDLALSPDGRTVAVPDNLGTVTFFDARTMRPSQPPAPLGVWSGHVAFSPDGRLLAVLASADPIHIGVALWDVATRHVLTRLPVPATAAAEAPGRPAWTADGRAVAVGSDTGSLFLDEVAGGSHRTVRIPGAGPGHPVDAFPAGRLVVAVPEGTRTAFTVDPVAAHIRGRVPLPVSVDHAGVDRTGSRLAVSDEAGDVYVVDMATGKARQMQGKHAGRVWGLVFSGDGGRLASFGDDAIVLIRDAGTGQRLLTFAGHTGRILGAAFSADDGELWTSALDRSVIAWDLTGQRSLGVTSSPETPGPFPDAQGPMYVAWSRDRTRAEIIWWDGRSAPLDTTTGRIGPTDRFPGRIGDVALSPDGHRAFLTVMDPATFRTVVERWDVARRRSDGSVDPGPDFIEGSLDLSPDGRVLAVGTFDDDASKRTPLFFLDASTLETLGAPLDVLPSPVVGFSPDGHWLALASATAAGVAVLDVPTGRVRWIDRSVSRAHVLGFSADGTRLAVGSEQGVVAVFDAASGARVAGPAEVQPAIVTATAFSPDGRTLVTTGSDGVVQLLQPTDLRPLATSLLPVDNVGRQAAFSPDGSHIQVLDHTGRLSVWEASPQAWLRRACSIADRDFTSDERTRYAITRDTPHPCP